MPSCPNLTSRQRLSIDVFWCLQSSKQKTTVDQKEKGHQAFSHIDQKTSFQKSFQNFWENNFWWSGQKKVQLFIRLPSCCS